MPGDDVALTRWMKWEELPWFSRNEVGGTALQLCDRILEAALAGPAEPEFLKQQLPEIANEFSLVWTAVLWRQPAWQAGAEFGRRPADWPTRLWEEALDRDAAVFHRPPGEGALLAVPLHGERHPGRILVCAGKQFGPEVLGAALAVGRTLGYGLQVVQHQARDHRRIDRLRATLRIASSFATVRDSVSLLEKIAHEATRLLATDRASIFIWDKEQKQIVARPALGVEGGVLRLPDNVGIVGETIQTGRTVRVDDAYQDARFNKQVDLKSGYRTRNLLCVPLLDGAGQRIGAFEVINKLEGDFTNEDDETLAELGIQAAIALQNTNEREQLARRHRQLTEQVTQGVQIIGESPAIAALRATIDRLAATDLPVLILGESGTGKEVVSQSLHYRGARRDHPFIAVNCAAITQTLLESELFGHEKGAFTDAHEMHKGKFELAHGGTLFLDEIGDMPLSGQAKLLRVLEQKVITRVGGSQTIPINVRIVAATNAKLQEKVRDKKFREDLFFRLSVVTLDLPPLRDRQADVLLLADFFLEQFCRQAKRPTLELLPAARQRLLEHRWPGNIRELRNLAERLAFLCPQQQVGPDDIPLLTGEAPRDEIRIGAAGLAEATNLFQQEFIRKAIAQAHGNMSRAAELLGLHRSNLYRKMRQLKMEEAEESEEE